VSLVHASCVAIGEAGVLITGEAGAGKSLAALRLIALGAALVADDQVALRREGAGVIAAAPETLAGRIEARGIGILALPYRAEVRLALVADLDRAEHARLPGLREASLLGQPLPLILARGLPDLAAMLFAWFGRGGSRVAP
jgi:HPr kinase/phosphorylase